MRTVWMYPVWVLLLIVVPGVSSMMWDRGLFLAQMACMGILAVAAHAVYRSGAVRWRVSRLDYPVILFLAWSFASIFFTAHQFFGFRRVIEIALYGIVFFGAAWVARVNGSRKCMIRMLLVGSGWVVAYGILQFSDVIFTGWEVQPWGVKSGRRIFSTLANPNWLGSYLVIVSPFVFGHFLKACTMRGAVIALAHVAGVVVCLVFTKSPASWFGFALAMGFYGFMLAGHIRIKRVTRKLMWCLTVAGALGIMAMMTQHPPVANDTTHLHERLLRYRSTLEIIKDYPVWGVGLGNSAIYADEYTAKFITEERFKSLWPNEQSSVPMMRDRAENEYLDIAGESGLPALAMWIWIIVALFSAYHIRIGRVKDRDKRLDLIASYASIAGFLTECFFGFPFHVTPTAFLICTVAGVNIACSRHPRTGSAARSMVWRPKDRRLVPAVFALAAVVAVFMFFKVFVGAYYLDRAIYFKKTERYTQAVARLDKAAQWDAANPALNFERGVNFRVLGAYEAAMDELKEYLNRRPKHFLAHYNLALCYRELESHDQALEEMRLALKLKPLFQFVHEEVDAMRNTVGPAEDEPPVVTMHYNRAAAYAEKGELDLAEAEFMKIASMRPEDAQAWNNIGVMRLAKRMPLAAAKAFEEALRLYPRSESMRQNAVSAEKYPVSVYEKEAQGRSHQPVPIVMYHKVSDKSGTVWWVDVDEFARQMDIIKAYGFTTVTLKDLYEYRYNGSPLPPKPIILTFDDGYQNFVKHAFPVLKRLEFKATVFVIVDHIGTQKPIPGDEGLEPTIRFMSKRQLLKLKRQGIEFGSHSLSHGAMTGMSDEDALNELRQSKKSLEKTLRQPVEFFCIPYGRTDEWLMAMMRESGYLGALIAGGGIEEVATANFYNLRRVLIRGGADAPDDSLEFIKKIDPSSPLPQIIDVRAIAGSVESEIWIGCTNAGDGAKIGVELYAEDIDSKKPVKQLNDQKIVPQQVEYGQEIRYRFKLDSKNNRNRLLIKLVFTDEFGLVEYASVDGLRIEPDEDADEAL